MQAILIPFAVAVFLYFLVSPIIDYLQVKTDMPRFLSTLTAITVGILVGGVVLLSFFLSIKLFAPEAGRYQEKLIGFAEVVRTTADSFGIVFDKSLIISNLSNIPVMDFIKILTGSLVGFAGNALLVLVILIFLLEGKDPRRKRSEKIELVTTKINRYVSTKFLTSVLTGFSVWFTLFVLDVDLAGMFGVTTFLLNFIPSIGSLIAILLPLPIVALDHGLGLVFALSLAIPGVAQFTIGNILEPKLLGEHLDLHPVIQLFSLLFWGAVWGVSGMFLAVPVTVIVKLFFEQFAFTKGIADFMAGRLS